MQFRLIYEGPLKANGGPKDKQHIRRAIHVQLAELIRRPPMQPFKRLVEARHARATENQLSGFTFFPLIAESLRHVADLEVVMFTPEEPGRTITQGGDLDNRMKTLLDALRQPKVPSELPKNDEPREGETPMLCLLEDDNLISGLSITAERLLRPVESKSDVLVIIRVVPKPTYSTIGEVQWSSI
jgi:hypothetical protein